MCRSSSSSDGEDPDVGRMLAEVERLRTEHARLRVVYLRTRANYNRLRTELEVGFLRTNPPPSQFPPLLGGALHFDGYEEERQYLADRIRQLERALEREYREEGARSQEEIRIGERLLRQARESKRRIRMSEVWRLRRLGWFGRAEEEQQEADCEFRLGEEAAQIRRDRNEAYLEAAAVSIREQPAHDR